MAQQTAYLARRWTWLENGGRVGLLTDDNKNSEHHPSSGQSKLAGLASRAGAGDQLAFRSWLEETHMIVYRLAYRILNDGQAAEDVTQETFARAWQNMARLRKPEASLGWVCRIARNVASDHLRSPKRREIPVLDRSPESGAASMVERMASPDLDPERNMLSAEVRAGVRAAVLGLKKKHRLVLLLREVDGMSYEEIASAVGVPRGTVESRIHRARANVKKALQRAALRETGSRL